MLSRSAGASKAADKRSPFPEPSLPQAGESGREAFIDLAMEKLLLPFLFAVAVTTFAGFEWFAYLTHTPPQPVVFTCIALGMIGFFAWNCWRYTPQLRQLRLGIRGEREVGRMLEDLRADGYRVYHDLPSQGDGEAFNVDHLLIGPAGVFVIETKTISKPPTRRGGRATVQYDGQRVRVDGHEPDRDPVAQAAALVRFVSDELHRQTGRRVDVRGVVLYPGWWVEGPGQSARVWVLNPKRLPVVLKDQPARLKGEDVALYADRIERLLRRA